MLAQWLDAGKPKLRFCLSPTDEKGQTAPAVIGEAAYSYYIIDETTDESGKIKVKNIWDISKLITIFRAEVDQLDNQLN